MVYFVDHDCETQGSADLSQVGAWLYAEHPATRLMCWVYKHNHTYHTIDYYGFGNLQFSRLAELAADPECIFVAHNAAFEQAMWLTHMVNYYGLPPVPIERWKCTMAKCHAHNLPGGLKEAAICLKLNERKDEEGSKIMKDLTKPKKDGTFWTPEERPEDFQRLYEYCRQDVVTEAELDKAIRDLTAKEQRVWCLDQRINQQGVKIDRIGVEKAMIWVEDSKEKLQARFQELTGLDLAGYKQLPRKPYLRWLQENGADIKNTQELTLKEVQKNTDNAEVREAITIGFALTRAALGKLSTLLAGLSAEDFYREAFVYCGATKTGRWSSRRAQLHNLKKPKGVDIRTVWDALHFFDMGSFEEIFGPTQSILARGIRGCLIAPDGTRCMGGDLAQMEARVLAWLAGDEDKLQKFRDGVDLYCELAERIFGRTITKIDNPEERQVGKYMELGFGYQGAIEAFIGICEMYEVDPMDVFDLVMPTVSKAEILEAQRSYAYFKRNNPNSLITEDEGILADCLKQKWRAANPIIVDYWDFLNRKAAAALITKKPVAAGKVTFFVHDRFLFCKLPSGRCLAYLYPKVEGNFERGTFKISYFEGKFRTGLYGGKFAENITQAVQRDLLVDVMLRLEEEYPVSFHVHDEVMSYVPIGVGSVEEFKTLMMEHEDWAEGIPINVDVWEGPRYAKG